MRAHILLILLLIAAAAGDAGAQAVRDRKAVPPPDLAPFFRPSPEYANDYGTYRSPLKFDDGREVKTAADWSKRREEILRYWHGKLGRPPELLGRPRLEVESRERRDGYEFQQVRVEVAKDHFTPGYLLLPHGKTPLPAVLSVFYEPETAVGLKGENRGFAIDLAKRGFATLSIGSPYTDNYPKEGEPVVQPLMRLAYYAANAGKALGAHAQVDPERVGIVGHSYGGKWAMFASAFYPLFAAAAWSDPGIVFDETRPNVNYWEPWYLGFERGPMRKRGVITAESPRTGPYKELMAEGRDLHELHALMAPRPFLVSGGSEDPAERWKALNHTVAVNRLLGYENRVMMTNRPAHSPTPESNEQLYRFFEWALKR
jgi:pimeloyl-ACP methyl ester carboxylesterase